jgi:hypothetical protein
MFLEIPIQPVAEGSIMSPDGLHQAHHLIPAHGESDGARFNDQEGDG